MSWASHEWKDGLPVKALSNIEELEKQRDRLRKELQQRQLQIESMEQVNTKQKQKFDVERMAYSAMATDNKCLMETCEQLEKKRHRLEYDLQMKEAQLLQIEEGYSQKKKQLDAQSHKSMMLERQLEKLEGMVSVMEVQEKNSVDKIKMVRDMLQDQHWHDVAQIAAERDATGHLKAKLQRTQNEFLKQKYTHKDVRNNGDRACAQANQSSGDSDELPQLEEKVVRLTRELRAQHQQCKHVVEERDALKEKFTDMLLTNQQQVTALSEQLHVLQAEHKGLVEQCSSQMSEELPVSPETTKKKPRARPVFCPAFSSKSTGARSRSWSAHPSLSDLKKKSDQQVSLTVVEKLRRELEEVRKGNIRLTREKAYLMKENNKLESDHIHMESQIVQLIQQSVPSTQAQSQPDGRAAVDLKSMKAKYSSLVTEHASQQEQHTEEFTVLEHKYKQAVDRNKDMQRQLEDAQRNGSGKRVQQSIARRKKQEDQLRSLKAEVTTLKAKLADSELLISKYQRDMAEKRKTHKAESQSLNNRLKKMTVARDQLIENLDEMTDRWKYLEQQVNSKVEMLAVFGEKLEVAESVANDLEEKFEVKMKKVETEQGRVENLKANLVSTRAALDNVLTKYNALKQDYDNLCRTRDQEAMKPDQPRPHGMPWGEAADFSGKKVGGGGGVNREEGHGKDRQMEELCDKLAQSEATVTQLKSKLLQLQDMNINGEMLINKKQQLVRKLEDQAKQDNSQMMDLQRALDRQAGQLLDKEKALAALRQRLNHLEAQVAREKDGAAQSTARAVEEHHTLEERVKTLEKAAASHDTTVKDLRKQLENAERLYQTQTEQCKKLEREKENLEKTSGVLCNEKQNVDSKIQELASELATVREKASAMEAQHKQKICTLDAEITTLKKELNDSVLQCEQQSERVKELQTASEERKLNEELLREQLKQQKDRAEKLSVLLDSAEQETARLSSELQAARDQCTATESQQTQLKSSSDTLVAELKDRVSTLEADNSALQCQLGELGAKLNAKCDDVQRLTNAQLELTGKNEQLMQEHRRLVDAGQQLQLDTDRLKKACEDGSARVVTLEKQLEEGNREWAGKLERADDALAALREKLQVLDIENDSLKMELSVTGHELEKRVGDRRVAEAKVTDLMATADTLRQQIATGREEKETLTAQVKKLGSERDAIVVRLNKCETELVKVKERLVESSGKSEALTASLNERLRVVADEKALLQQELKEATLKLDCDDEAAVATARQLSQCQEHNQQLLQQVQGHKDAVEQLKAMLSGLEEEKGKIAAELDDMKGEMNAVKSAKEKLQCDSTGLVEDLQRRQKEEQEEKMALKIELEGAVDRLKTNEEMSAATMRELSQYREHNEQLLQQIQESKNAVEQFKSLLSCLEEEKGKIFAKLEKTEDELNTVKSSKETLQCESTGLVEELRRKLKEEENKRVDLEAELQEAMAKLDNKEECIASSVSELSQTKEANEQLLQQIQESKNAVEHLKSMLSALEKEKDKFAAELEDTKEELNTVKTAKEKLQCESTGLIEDLQNRQRETEQEKMALKTELEEALMTLNSNEENTASVVAELSEYKERSGQLLQQIQESKNATEQLTSMVSSLEEEKGKITAKLEVTENELNAVKSLRETLQCESTGLIEDLERRQRETEGEKMALKTELEEALAKLDSNEENAASVMQELSQCKEHNEQLLQQNGVSKEALDAVQQKMAMSEETSEKLLAELAAVREELRSRSQEQEAEQCQSTGLIADLREQCKKAEEMSVAHQKDLQDALLKLDDGQEVMTGVVQKLEAARERESSLLQQQEQLKQRLVAMETATVELEAEKDVLAERCSQLEAERAAVRAEEAESRTKQEALVVELRERITVADAARDTAKNDADAAAFRMENLTEDLESLSEQLEESTTRQIQLEQRCTELKASLGAVEHRLVEAEREKCDALARVEQLQATADGLRTELAALRLDEGNVHSRVQQLESDAHYQREKLLATDEQLNQLQVALTAQEACCSSLQQEKSDLASDLDTATRQVAHLQGEKKELLASVERLETVIVASQASIDELRQEAVAAEETKVALSATLAAETHRAEKAAADARQQIEQLQTKLHVAEIEHANSETSHTQNEADFESRIQQLQTDIAGLRTENGDLSARLKDTEFLLATASQQGVTLQAETEKTDADMTALLETHAAEMTRRDKWAEDLQADLSRLQAELGRQEGDLARSQDRVSELEKQLLTTQEEMSCNATAQSSAETERDRERAEFKKHISDLEAAVSEKSRLLETLESDVQMAKMSADCSESDLQAALQSQVGKTKEIEATLHEEESRHVSELDSLMSEHAFKLSASQGEIDALQQEVERLRGELQSRSDQLQSVHTEYTSHLAAAKHELGETALISEMSNEELGKLREELDDLKVTLGKRERKLKVAEDELASVKVELSARTEELEQTKFVGETQVREVEGARSRLEAQLRVGYECGEDTDQQLRDRAEEVVVLNQRVTSLEASIAQADVEKSDLKEQYQTLCAEKDRIVAENEKQHAGHQVAVSELERQLCDARDQLEDGGTQLGVLRDSVCALEKALSTEEERHSREEADLTLRINQLVDEVKEKQAEVDRVQSQLDIALAAVEDQAMTAQSKSTDLSCALHEMEQKNFTQQRQLENQLSELQAQLQFAAETAESEKAVLQNELSTLHDQLSETKDMLHAGDVKHSQTIAELEAEVSRLTMAVEQLERRATVSEEQLTAAKLEVDERTEELSAARERIKSLTEESDRLGSSSQQEQECAREKLRLVEAQLTDTEVKLAAANDDKLALEQKLSEATTMQAQLQQEVVSLEGSTKQAAVKRDDQLALVERLQRQVEDARTWTESETSRFNTMVEELQLQLSQAGAQETDTVDRCGAIESDLATSEEKLAAANKQVVELEGKLSEAGTAEAQLRQQVASLEASREQLRMQGEEQEAAWGDLREKHDRCTDLYNCDVTNLRQAIATLERRLQEKQEVLEDTQQELDLQKSHSEKLIRAENDRILIENEKQVAMSELERQLCDARDQLDDSGTQLGVLRDSVCALEKALSTEEERHSREEADFTLRINQLENEVKEKQAEVDRVQSQLDIALAAVEDQAMTSESKSTDLSCALHEMEQKNFTQQRQLENQLSELQAQLQFVAETAESEKAVLQNELSTLHDQLSETKDMLHAGDVKHSQTIAELEAEVSRLTMTVEQLERRAMVSEEQLTAAKLEVDERTEELSAARERIKSLTEESDRLGSSSQQEQECAREKLRLVEAQLTNTEVKLAAANDDKLALEQKLSEATTMQAQLQQEVVSLEGSTKQAAVKRDDQLALVERLQRQVEDARTWTESETSRLNTMVEELQLQLSQAGAQETDTVDRCGAIESDLATSEEKLAAANKQVVELEGKLSEAGTAEAQLRQQVASLEASREQLRMQGEEQEAALGDLREKHDHCTDLYNCDVTNLRQAIATLERRLQEKQEVLDDTQQELETLRADVESARTDAQTQDEENTRLHSQVEAKQTECGALAEQLQEQREQLEELNEQKSQFVEQMCELQSHLSAVSSERDRAVEQCEAVQAEHRELQEMSSQVDVAHDQLTSITEQLRGRVEKMEQEKGEMEAKAEEREELLQVIQMEAEGLQTELEESRRTSHDLQASLEALQAERDAAVSAAAGHQGVLARREAETEALRREVREMEVDWESKTREVEELGRTVGRLEQEAEEAESEARRLEERCGASLAAQDNLLAEVDAARAQYSRAQQRVCELETAAVTHGDSVNTLTADLETAQSNNNHLQQELTQLTVDTTTVTQQLADAQRDLDTMRQEVAALEQQVSDERLRRETLQVECADLGHKVDKLLQDKAELECQVAQLGDQMEQLVVEKAELQMSNEELVARSTSLKATVTQTTQELNNTKVSLETKLLEMEQLRSKVKLLEHAQEELEQLRSKAKRLEHAQEELEQLRSKVKLLEHAQEELEQLRSKAKLLEETQAELIMLKKKIDEASKEQLHLKEECDTRRTTDDKTKTELEQKTKDVDVWRSRFQSLLQRYHLLEEESDTLKDRLEGPVVVEPQRSRISTRQSVSTKQPSQAKQVSQQPKKMCHEIITSKSTTTATGRSTAMEPPRSRICTRQSVSTKRPSHVVPESQQAKKMCHENVSSKSKTTATGESQAGSERGTVGSDPSRAPDSRVNTKQPKQQTPATNKTTQAGKHRQIRRIARIQTSSVGVDHTTSLNAKALAVITNSPKKATCPATDTKSTTPLTSPATKCLSLKKTPDRLTRRRLAPSTEAADDNPENCEVQ